MQNERELARGRENNGFDRTAEALVSRLPDSKGPEDVHQKERDETRSRRNASLNQARVYRTQITSRDIQHHIAVIHRQFRDPALGRAKGEGIMNKCYSPNTKGPNTQTKQVSSTQPLRLGFQAREDGGWFRKGCGN